MCIRDSNEAEDLINIGAYKSGSNRNIAVSYTHLITYLHTDSVRISEEADAQAHEYIGKNYGENYLATQTTAKKSGAKIQDAHSY